MRLQRRARGRSSTFQLIRRNVYLIHNLRAALDHFVDYVRIVLYIVERNEEYCFDVLDGVDPLLPRLRLRVPQKLGDLLKLTEYAPPIL